MMIIKKKVKLTKIRENFQVHFPETNRWAAGDKGERSEAVASDTRSPCSLLGSALLGYMVLIPWTAPELTTAGHGEFTLTSWGNCIIQRSSRVQQIEFPYLLYSRPLENCKPSFSSLSHVVRQEEEIALDLCCRETETK